MSKKVITPNTPVIANGDMSGNLTATPTTIQFMDNVCYQCNFTGSPVGVFNVQVSNDGVNWATIVPPAPNAAGFPTSAGSPVIIDVNQTSAAKSRLVYTASSGTGSLTVLVSGKEV